MRVLIIIPAYNEEATILDVVRDVEAAGYDYVVINDGSSDNTARICEEHGLNFIDLFFNLGIGGAIQAGHLYAYQQGYDVDVQFDGDGQHDISYVPALLEQIEAGYDIVVGSRFVQRGPSRQPSQDAETEQGAQQAHAVQAAQGAQQAHAAQTAQGIQQAQGFQSTGLRRLGIRWLERCIRFATGATIKDSTSGFRATGKRAIALFAEQYPVDYPEPESLVAALNTGLKVCEVPVIMHERKGGVSSINLWKGAYYMVKVSLAIFIEGHFRKPGKK